VSTVATVTFITAATGMIGWLAFGAMPRPGELLALTAGLVMGTVCFATLGLAISSVITSAESAGPVAYASFLPIAIVSGVFDPTFSGLPGLAVTPSGHVSGQGAGRGTAERLRGAPIPGLEPGHPRTVDRRRRRLHRVAFPLAQLRPLLDQASDPRGDGAAG